MPQHNIKTDATLLKRLQASAGKPLSEDEVKAQRVSFIRGSVSRNNSATKEQIEKVLGRLEHGE